MDALPPAPIPASLLAEREQERRNTIRQRGYFTTGCADLDVYMLRGGLEGGQVVGLSAEEEAFGLALAMQLLSRALVRGMKGLVITPQPGGAVVRGLRESVRGEMKMQEQEQSQMNQQTQTEQQLGTCLDNAMLSCVFDMDGLWEVLSELDHPSEIPDSQDSSPPSSLPSPASSSSSPDIILITHFSSLLTSLFTQRASPAAHETLALLYSRLRYLSRTLPSSPLILVLNSTTSSSSSTSTAETGKPLDPSLRSVFSPPALCIPGYASAPRRNKPSFGLVFTQVLDLHLLATRVARTRDDAEVLLGGNSARQPKQQEHAQEQAMGQKQEAQQAQQAQQAQEGGKRVTVVEVLLDEMGVWTGELGTRPGREQRWAAVEVRRGRVVDAFARIDAGAGAVDVRVRTSGGFGGRRA